MLKCNIFTSHRIQWLDLSPSEDIWQLYRTTPLIGCEYLPRELSVMWNRLQLVPHSSENAIVYASWPHLLPTSYLFQSLLPNHHGFPIRHHLVIRQCHMKLNQSFQQKHNSGNQESSSGASKRRLIATLWILLCL